MRSTNGVTREGYVSRINRVIDYIEVNITQELTLEELSKVAHFSRFHFHRIFRAIVGETLHQFIQRLRIEKAANQLIDNPEKTITEIAFDCGFSGSASFARVFKEAYGMSAGKWRTGGYLQKRGISDINSKKSKLISNNREAISHFSYYDSGVTSYYVDSKTRNPIWRIKMRTYKQIEVAVKNMPEFHVAYIRHIGPYKGDSDLFESLFERLMKWAAPRGLLRFPETKVLSVYHDDPKFTDEDKLRTSVCISVPEDTLVEGEIGKMLIPGGSFAVAGFEIGSDEFEEAWNTVMGNWLPESGYQPDDRLCYELCHNDPKEHPEHKHIIDICVPVKPL